MSPQAQHSREASQHTSACADAQLRSTTTAAQWHHGPPTPRLHALSPPMPYRRAHTSNGRPQQCATSEARRLRGNPRIEPSSSTYMLTPTKPLSRAVPSSEMFSTCAGWWWWRRGDWSGGGGGGDWRGDWRGGGALVDVELSSVGAPRKLPSRLPRLPSPSPCPGTGQTGTG